MALTIQLERRDVEKLAERLDFRITLQCVKNAQSRILSDRMVNPAVHRFPQMEES